MPSRPLPPPSTNSTHRAKIKSFLFILAISCFSLFFLLLLALFLLYLYFRLLRRAPTLPLDAAAAPPDRRLRRFTHRELRAATAGFEPARVLGRGASAAVFRGILPDGKSVAVKQLLLAAEPPAVSAAADREFQNELQVLGSIPASPFVVSLLGYCLEGRRRVRQLLVYEYVAGGSLQEALFGAGEGASPPPALGWDRRFQIILDVAQALAFLHLECDPPVIHGDIKPSNVLLTSDFCAKISDFGLSRIRDDGEMAPEFLSQELGPSQELWRSQELDPESPPVDFAFARRASSSSGRKKIPVLADDKGKESTFVASSLSTPLCDEELNCGQLSKRSSPNALWGKDWWWKQDGSGELSSKDYVQEWVGSQVCPSSNPDWDEERRNSPLSNPVDDSGGLDEVNFVESSFDFGKKVEMQPVKCVSDRDKKNKKAREWWREEYFAEISKKGRSKKGLKWLHARSHHVDNSSTTTGNGNKRGAEMGVEISFRKGWKKKRTRSTGSEMWSGDIFSRELSSTTSMRGTVCYIAPEYGGCGHLMEKADIYSFGVLILVIISGRRPLHVLPSPMMLEKANLITWCRQLAHCGNVLELVDERLKASYNKDQASLCINLALLCLQRTPELRPDSGDIVKILKGEMELPVVPFEFSPSPRSRLFSKSRRKTMPDAE